jgi:hypothetical protein
VLSAVNLQPIPIVQFTSGKVVMMIIIIIIIIISSISVSLWNVMLRIIKIEDLGATNANIYQIDATMT